MMLNKTKLSALAAVCLVVGSIPHATAQTQEPSSGSQRNGSPPTLSPSQTDPSSGAIKPGPGIHDNKLDDQTTGSTRQRNDKGLGKGCPPNEPLNSLDAVPRHPSERC